MNIATSEFSYKDKSLRVLSIDFDVFYDLGPQYSYTQSSTVSWEVTYNIYNDLLKDFKFNYKEFDLVKNIISKHKGKTFIGEDHSMVFSILHEHYSGNIFDIVNVDHHMDTAYDSNTITCASWLSFLSEYETINSFTWRYFTQQRDEDYGKIYSENMSNINILNSNFSEKMGIGDISKEFDIIFLVQSQKWSPPHMYHKFRELCDIAVDGIYSENYPVDMKSYKERLKYDIERNLIKLVKQNNNYILCCDSHEDNVTQDDCFDILKNPSRLIPRYFEDYDIDYIK